MGTEQRPDQADVDAVDRELGERLEAAYDENGVDRLLIRENLELTPTERVRELEVMLEAPATVRRIDPPG